MSMFMPDGATTQPPSGVADITPANPETTSADIALMQRVLSAASRNPNLIPADFMAYMLDWIQTQRLQIPLTQVVGYQANTQSSRVENSATQTVPTGTTRTVLQFDTRVFDYGGMWDSGADTKLTVQRAGKYVVGCHVNWANTAGDHFIAIRTNGSDEIAVQVDPATSSIAPDMSVSTLLDLAVGDYIETVVLQNSGSSQKVNTARTFQWAVRVGA